MVVYKVKVPFDASPNATKLLSIYTPKETLDVACDYIEIDHAAIYAFLTGESQPVATFAPGMPYVLLPRELYTIQSQAEVAEEYTELYQERAMLAKRMKERLGSYLPPSSEGMF